MFFIREAGTKGCEEEQRKMEGGWVIFLPTVWNFRVALTRIFSSKGSKQGLRSLFQASRKLVHFLLGSRIPFVFYRRSQQAGWRKKQTESSRQEVKCTHKMERVGPGKQMVGWGEGGEIHFSFQSSLQSPQTDHRKAPQASYYMQKMNLSFRSLSLELRK